MSSGYGKNAYGNSSYGSVDTTPPRVSSAVSLDGYRVEVFFSEEMIPNSVFLDPASYVLTPVLGAASTVLSVTRGADGPLGSPLSAILTHSGTTLGGAYTVEVVGAVVDLNGIGLDISITAFLSKGEAATFNVVPQPSGEEIILEFNEDMIPEGTFPGIEDPNSYLFETTYPINLTVDSITHPSGGDFSKVSLDVSSMTSATYSLEISPSTAIPYDGSTLPSDATGFDGVEFETGSSALVPQGLSLTKISPNTYGWLFEDTSGRVTNTSTFKFDWSVQLSSAYIQNTQIPIGIQNFERFNVFDGTTAFDIYLAVNNGVKVVRLISGTFNTEVEFDWVADFEISLVRNQIAGLVSVLIDGAPITSNALGLFNGTDTPLGVPGCSVTLEPDFNVNDAILSTVVSTASDTIFSQSWNFSHNTINNFVGIPGPSRQTFPTERGPLVKGWGDATPAGPEDVAVYIDGIRVAVQEVNPYIGEITLTIPIPLFAPGAHTVEVDYIWFENPIFPLAGLNTPGLTLNTWSRVQMGHQPFTPGSGLGTFADNRFVYSVVLGPYKREQPLLVGHRFIALDTSYTASLNSPTTLLLNQNPHAIAVPGLENVPQGDSISYEGNESPTESTNPWTLEGVDSGFLEVDQGTYRVVDDSAGTFETGTSALYTRDADLSYPNEINIAVRFQEVSYEADGVFTGIAFGAHDNRRLYLVGLLDINNVKHVGMLSNNYAPQERNSWFLGGSISAEILNTSTFQVKTEDWPKLIDPGTRFQIFDSNQAGTYTIASFEANDFGYTVVSIETPGFPFDPQSFGSKDVTIVLEVPFDEFLSTYRLVIDPDEGKSTLSFSGSLSTELLSLTKSASYALPSGTTLTFDTSKEGQIFWGSVSREAKNDSRWTFVRYGVTPDQTMFNSRGIIVSSEMNEVPEDDPNSEWDVQQDFGYSEIDFSGDNLLLKNTVGSQALDFTYHYRRIEPKFVTTNFSDVEADFSVESGRSGYGSGSILVNDRTRQIELSTLLYSELSGTRELLSTPYLSASGILTPTSQGWTNSTTFTISEEITQRNLVLSQDLGEFGSYEATLQSFTGDEGSILFEGRFRVDSYTVGGSGFTGVVFGSDSGVSGTFRHINLTLRPGEVVFTDQKTPGFVVASFPFNWDDQGFHTYRVDVDVPGDLVSLFIDDTDIGTVAWTSFGISSTETFCQFGYSLADAETQVTWDSLSVIKQAPTTAKRTLGIWLGGDKSEINNWKIPRTDTTDESNSSLIAVVEEMDWRSPMQVRLHRDPLWGVAMFRPDLPLPPGATGDFATETTQPSNAWINVEYVRLPRAGSMFGFVGFGAMNADDVVQQRWEAVRYRIYTTPDKDMIAPQNMVLNHYNVVSSGEALTDVSVESVVIQSRTKTSIEMRSADIFADRIFKVLLNDVIIPSDTWIFDKSTQIITLDSELPLERTPVTVIFAPSSDPVTKTYLESQPLLQSNTLLNEDTPYFYSDLNEGATRIVRTGSQLNNPYNTLGSPDFVLNDSLKYVDFETGEDSWFECLDIFTLDNSGTSGLIVPFCETTENGGGGYYDLVLDGGEYEDFLDSIKDPESGGLGYGCFILSGGAEEHSIIPPSPDARDVLCSGYAPGLATDPNAKPLNVPVTISLIDGGILTTIYLF